MENYQEHYKERDPADTVNSIKKILQDAKIKVDEHWLEISEIDTYTMRLTIKGTNIGTNGKGVSKELAAASAYAEFVERLENDLLWGTQWFQSLSSSHDGIKMTSEELVENNSSFLQSYFSKRGLGKCSKRKKAAHFKEMEILQKQVSDEDNTYTTIPFYNLTSNQLEFLPLSVYPLYYGSNGMCAGNTREEALVQGLSEIIERFIQAKCFQENLCFPDIPEDDIKKYPYVWEMFERVQQVDGIKAWMKDCSMNGKYPVAALLVLHEDSGRYGIKFGCHPIMSIAMERTLTEATQGQKIAHFATSSHFDFFNTDTCERYNMENAMKVGIGQYPHQLFSDTPSFPYKKYKDLSSYSNKEILQYWLHELKNDGYNILIRNVSYLGFHAYHIIIPGISEIRENTDSFSRKYNTRLYASYLLHKISNVNKDNLKYVIGAVESFMMCINENRLYSLFSMTTEQDLPGNEIREENNLFCALAYLALTQYEKSLVYIGYVIKKAISEKDKNLSFYLAIQNYTTGMKIYNSHEIVISYIKKLFSKNISDKIDTLFIEQNKIIQKVYGRYCIDNSNDEYQFEFLQNLQMLKKQNQINQVELNDLLSA